MKRFVRIPVLSALAVATVLSAGALRAEDNVAGGQNGNGVTFMNEGKSAVQVYARFGQENECSDKAQAAKLKIKGGETTSVDTAGASLCYCLERPDRLNNCSTGWFKADPGAKLRLR
jgi:hypothetical protein